MKTLKLFLILLIPILSNAQSQLVAYLPEEMEVTNQEDCSALILTFEVLPGHYIQADEDQLVNELLIPTQFHPVTNKEFNIRQLSFSKPKEKWMDGEKNLIFEGRFTLRIEFDTKITSPQTFKKLEGKLSYQACDISQCFLPKTLLFTTELKKART